jgi:hypothetical protein
MALITVDSTPERNLARFRRNAGNQPIASWKCKMRANSQVGVSFARSSRKPNKKNNVAASLP